ncbi:energy transducer TonB [uncultured Algibacter sp.]|uniref:energy transducer TonB n=1 Tax=uncultured Algibacter sp. TaxID=298659 RepID=UPI002601E400|nr:energy transducer TonB [uncultured Algibacter sp.]
MKHLILALFLVASCVVFPQKKKRHGPFEDYYKSGELKTLGQYREGKRIGKWQDFYETGQLSKIYTYNSNGRKTGFQESYYKNGGLKNKTIKLKSGDFIKNGFYEEGTLLYEMMLSSKPNSKLNFLLKNGLYREFYKNKNVKIETNYKDDQLSGLWVKYYDSGEKEWEVEYYLDYKQGAYKKYFKNGQIELEGTTALGLKNGVEKRYNEKGLILLKGTYDKDKLDGEWFVYEEAGDKTSTVKFKKGIARKSKNNIVINPTKIPEGDFEQVPIYPGCELALGNFGKKKCMSEKVAKFVNKSFNTNLAFGLGLEGRQKINIIFKIDKTGSVTGIRVRAPHPSLEEEAKYVISKLPKMEPGMQRGKAVVVPYSLPIIFMVKSKKKKDIFEDPFYKGVGN